MQIIKTKKGIRYREEFYLPDGRRMTKVFQRKTDALKWKREMLVAKENRSELPTLKRNAISFEVFANEWLETKVKFQCSKSTYLNYSSNLRVHILPLTKGLYLHQITKLHADLLVKSLRETGHNEQGTNKILRVFKGLLLEAEKTENIKKNPLAYYSQLKMPKRTPVYWTTQEINQFLCANVNNPFYSLFLVALNTGMRRGELAGLCWDQVDFANNLLVISRIRDRNGLKETTKTGRTRHVPMNSVVRETLLELWKNPFKSSFVFEKGNDQPIDVQHVYRLFTEAERQAEMARKIRFHDLRHTFASQFMMAGGNIYDLQKILGHAKVEMTQVYAHLSPEHLAQASNIISFSAKIPEGNPTYFPHNSEAKEKSVVILKR